MTEQHAPKHAEPRFRERLLDPRTLDPPLRIVVGIALAQVIATSLLLLLHPTPDLVLFPAQSPFGEIKVPRISYILSCAFLLIASTLFVAGAIDAGSADPRGVGFLFSVLIVSYSILLFAWPYPAATAITLAVDIVFIIFMGYLVNYVWGLITGSSIPFEDMHPSRKQIVLYLLILPPGSIFIIYIIMAFPLHFAAVLFLIRGPVIALFAMAAVDWAQLVDSMANSVSSRLSPQRMPMLIVGLLVCALSATGLFLLSWHRVYLWDAFMPAAVIGLAFIAVLALLVWLFETPTDTHSSLPWAGLVLIILVYLVVGEIGWRKGPLTSLLFDTVLTLVMTVLFCVCACSRFSRYSPVLLFGVLSGLGWMLFGTTKTNGLIIGLAGAIPILFATSCAAVTVVLLAITRSSTKLLISRLQCLLVLIICLWLVDGLVWLYGSILEHSERAVVEAIVVAVAIGGEILLSGHHVTNLHTPWFPRTSRILLFCSFVSITLAIVLLTAPFHGEGAQVQGLKVINNPEFVVFVGMFIYAPALLGVLFIMRIKQTIREPKILRDQD